MNESELVELKSKVQEIITFYESGNAVVFENGGRKEVDQRIDNATNSDDSQIIRLVKKLFTTVSFVLEEKGLKTTAGNRYSDWIVSFCKVNFTKSRGRLGTTLSLTQEMLLFLVKLCVGEADKIRLNSLWTKLEDRGLKFDEVSKSEIIRLFERINLLEKNQIAEMHNTSSQLYKYIARLIVDYFTEQRIAAGDRYNVYLENDKHVEGLYQVLQNMDGIQLKNSRINIQKEESLPILHIA